MRRYSALFGLFLGLIFLVNVAGAQSEGEEDFCNSLAGNSNGHCLVTPEPTGRGGSQSVANVSAPAPSASNTSELATLYRRCEEARSTAGNACGDSASTDGMSRADASQYASTIASLGPLITAAGAASGNANICRASAALAGASQIITMMKGNTCNGTRNFCTDVCRRYYRGAEARLHEIAVIPQPQQATYAQEVSTLTRNKAEADDYVTSCQRYAVQVAQTATQGAMLANSVVQGMNCKDALSSSAVPTATPVSLTTGTTDCSNAAFASTNVACICRANPGDAMCGNLGPGNTAGTGGASGGLSATTPTLSGDSASDGSLVDQSAIGSKGTTGSYGAGSSGGGGGLGGGSGSGGGLGGGDDGGVAGSGLDKNVILGTSGSGGGVGALSAGTSGGGGGGGRAGSGSGAGAGGGFNLSKYLPKSLFKNRGLAGMTIPSTDGMTGPMGPTIWEKVSNRYQQQKSNLIQDK